MKTSMINSVIMSTFFVLTSFLAFSQAGTLDNSFGNNGIVIYNYGAGFHDFTNDVHVYDDGSILVVGGFLDNVAYNSTGNFQKFLPDGSIDVSWGTNGMVTFQYGVSTIPYSMIVLPDGKILISGVMFYAADAEFFAARFNPDGTPDMTFNGTGVWIGSYPDNVEMSCNAMALQQDGKIILAGRNGVVFSTLLFYRLNSDGTLDTGFGTNGYTEINSATQNESVDGVGLLSDGTIIGVGYTHLGDPWYGEFATMIKLEADGNPYPGFGTNGVLIPSVFDDYSKALDCTIVNDSVIISATYGDPNVSEDLAITRLDQNGNSDSGFGNNGISILDIDQLTYGETIFYGDDNKYYIGGSSGQGGIGASRDFFLARYNYNGSIDATFAGNGYVKTAVGTAWDHAYGLDMGPDGKIVLAGFTAWGTTGDNDRALARYLNDFAPSLTANFTSESTTTCEGESIQFNDLSLGTVVSWNWSFPGGDPSTSTLQNPEILYNTAGVYDVELEVSDGNETVSIIKENYITVGAYPAPEINGQQIVCSGDEEIYQTTDNPGNTYSWAVIGGEIISGNNTHQITVLWSEPGSGAISLTEETSEGCSFTTDEYLVAIEACTGISLNSANKIEVYPNPVRDKLFVKGLNIQNIEIISSSGITVYRSESVDQNTGIDLRNISNGIYILKIETLSNIETHKILVK